MPDKDHKRAEREICTAMGGRRSGPLGFNSPDCVGTPGLAIEVKLVPNFRYREKWIEQAKTNTGPGETWILVQKQRQTGKKLIMMEDFDLLAEMYMSYLKERNL